MYCDHPDIRMQNVLDNVFIGDGCNVPRLISVVLADAMNQVEFLGWAPLRFVIWPVCSGSCQVDMLL
jgi:hypothetical protein